MTPHSLPSVEDMQQEYHARRMRLLSHCHQNAIVIVPANKELTRSRDTEYPFRQDSDFFYLTGFNEPDAFLVLSNQDINNDNSVSIVFLRPKNKNAEIWQGRRLGVLAAPSTLNVDIAHSIDDIDELLPELMNGHEHLYYSLGAYPHADNILQRAITVCKSAPKQSKQAPVSIIDVAPIIHAMRLIKSSNEIALMQRSADISCEAHTKAMQICRPGMYEYQLEATILHHFAMQGARYPAYASIVGSGENACILHYTENNKVMQKDELVLIDAGSEFEGYAADITRTFPVCGKFTDVQKEIYTIVLDTQLACIDALKPGVSIAEVMTLAVKLTTQGLIDLGILHGDIDDLIKNDAHREYFMHGLGHYLGLDVHDVGNYKQDGKDKALEIGMVLTVEPGIYISKDSNAPDKYKGIGIRIEDNVVITASGNKVLTSNVVKTIHEIEALMASKPQ